MFVDDNVVPTSLEAHRTPLSEIASDHLPLVMRCRLKLAEQPRAKHPAQIVA